MIPAYNEDRNIEKVLTILKNYFVDIVVIDDGSTDKTTTLVKKNKCILLHSEHRGKGKALEIGINYIKTKQYKFIIFMDADLQHDPRDIPLFLNKFREKNADFIVGSRFLVERKVPWQIRIVNLLHNKLLNKYLRMNLTDYTCGFRAIINEHVNDIIWNSEGYSVEIEQIILARKKGLIIVEIPVNIFYSDQNKISIEKIFTMTKQIHQMLYTHFKDELKGVFYILIGIIIFIISWMVLIHFYLKFKSLKGIKR